jgi:hypothetical protein
MARVAEILSQVTPTTIIPLVSLIISLLSAAIAVASFRRSRQIQEYDYATRLQIEQEQIHAGGPRPEDAFSYSAQLVNVGLKPVEIDNIYIDYGGDTLETSWHFNVEGNSHISPSGRRRVEFSLSEKDYHATLAKFALQECLFQLRVRYFNVTGGIVEAQRKLVAIGPGGRTFYAQRGDALT